MQTSSPSQKFEHLTCWNKPWSGSFVFEWANANWVFWCKYFSSLEGHPLALKRSVSSPSQWQKSRVIPLERRTLGLRTYMRDSLTRTCRYLNSISTATLFLYTRLLSHQEPEMTQNNKKAGGRRAGGERWLSHPHTQRASFCVCFVRAGSRRREESDKLKPSFVPAQREKLYVRWGWNFFNQHYGKVFVCMGAS